jgi:hypothetical protein
MRDDVLIAAIALVTWMVRIRCSCQQQRDRRPGGRSRGMSNREMDVARQDAVAVDNQVRHQLGVEPDDKARLSNPTSTKDEQPEKDKEPETYMAGNFPARR